MCVEMTRHCDFFHTDMSSGFCATPNFSATALNHTHHQIHPASLHHHNGTSGGGSHGHMGMANLGGSTANPALALTASAVLDTTCFLGPGWTPAGLNEARECVNCGAVMPTHNQ